MPLPEYVSETCSHATGRWRPGWHTTGPLRLGSAGCCSYRRPPLGVPPPPLPLEHSTDASHLPEKSHSSSNHFSRYSEKRVLMKESCNMWSNTTLCVVDINTVMWTYSDSSPPPLLSFPSGWPSLLWSTARNKEVPCPAGPEPEVRWARTKGDGPLLLKYNCKYIIILYFSVGNDLTAFHRKKYH